MDGPKDGDICMVRGVKKNLMKASGILVLINTNIDIKVPPFQIVIQVHKKQGFQNHEIIIVFQKAARTIVYHTYRQEEKYLTTCKIDAKLMYNVGYVVVSLNLNDHPTP